MVVHSWCWWIYIYIGTWIYTYTYIYLQVFSSVQLLSCVQLFVTLWTAVCQASLSITNTWSLLKLMSIEPVMPSNHLILCCPLLLLPLIFPSIRAFPISQFFTSGGQSIEASASASVLPMNIQDWFPLELTGLISLQSKGLSEVFSRVYWTPQFKSINCLALSFIYGTTLTSIHDYWNTIALTRWTYTSFRDVFLKVSPKIDRRAVERLGPLTTCSPVS